MSIGTAIVIAASIFGGVCLLTLCAVVWMAGHVKRDMDRERDSNGRKLRSRKPEKPDS
mgnify:CR=1 FL=1